MLVTSPAPNSGPSADQPAVLVNAVPSFHLATGAPVEVPLAPGPMVSLNRAVAVAMVAGPAAGLGLLGELAADQRLAGHHRLHATRAHLLEMSGDDAAAAASYRTAARLTTSVPERRYLMGRAARLAAK
jgi:predicted RNA polymerase sigma factor